MAPRHRAVGTAERASAAAAGLVRNVDLRAFGAVVYFGASASVLWRTRQDGQHEAVQPDDRADTWYLRIFCHSRWTSGLAVALDLWRRALEVSAKRPANPDHQASESSVPFTVPCQGLMLG